MTLRTGRPRRRGSLVLGMAILVFVLIAFCGLVLGESLEMYREQVLAERRHQERAAFEAAITALRDDPSKQVATIEGERFSATIADSASDAATVRRRVSVEVLGKNGEAVHAASKTIVFEREGDAWIVGGMEP